MRNRPSPSVVATRAWLVSVLVAVTVAPGSTASVVSRTTPARSADVARVCAWRNGDEVAPTSAIASTTGRGRTMGGVLQFGRKALARETARF